MKRQSVDNDKVTMQRTMGTGEHGFSLIEVLIAIAILAVGMLAIGSMQLATVRNTTNSHTTTEAIMLAHERMEEVKNISDLADIDTLDGANETNIGINGEPGIFNRTTTISNPPDIAGIATSTSTFAREVQIDVQWTTVHGGNRTITLNSITHGGGI